MIFRKYFDKVLCKLKKKNENFKRHYKENQKKIFQTLKCFRLHLEYFLMCPLTRYSTQNAEHFENFHRKILKILKMFDSDLKIWYFREGKIFLYFLVM